MIGSLPAAGRVIRRVLVQPAAALSVTFIVLLALLATFAGALGLDPLTQDVARMLEGPSRDYPFGTDELGRDILARVVYGARTSLVTAAGAVMLAATIGVPIGLIAGFFGGWRDAVLMRIVDLLLALPGILVRDELDQRLRHSPAVAAIREDIRLAVLGGTLGPVAAADRILACSTPSPDRPIPGQSRPGKRTRGGSPGSAAGSTRWSCSRISTRWR